MAIAEQLATDEYAIFLGDSMEVLPTLPDESIHLSIYSPPFATEQGGALYHYTSSERDLSNSRTYAEFLDHYGFFVREIHRLTKPGRITAVHCTDVPTSNSGGDAFADFPGDIVRLHRANGWDYVARYHVWKEPLTVRNRTMKKDLAHRTLTEDSTRCSVAAADYLLCFRRHGENTVPVTHPQGLTEYAGERPIPHELLPWRNWTGNQRENRFSHWIWRQYASAFWDDIRLNRVVPFREARDDEDERHVHPLQLDVIDRALALWTNTSETVLTPFMGVGSEVYGAVRARRRAIGIELKPAYYRQAVKNLEAAATDAREALSLLDLAEAL